MSHTEEATMVKGFNLTFSDFGWLNGRRIAVHSAIWTAANRDVTPIINSPAMHRLRYIQNHTARTTDKLLRGLNIHKRQQYEKYLREIDAIDPDFDPLAPRGMDFGRLLNNQELGYQLVSSKLQDVYMGKYGMMQIENARWHARNRMIKGVA